MNNIIKIRSIKSILGSPIVVVQRQIEFGNLIFGIEQINRYVISNPQGTVLGYAVERERSMAQFILRQFTRLHRPFTVDLFDADNNHLFKLQRNFSFINSRVKVINEINSNNEQIMGESIQRWHAWRRRYELFVREKNDDMIQFGDIDAPFLSYDFPVSDSRGKIIGSVDRNWVGLGRELFTDTGVYVVRFDSQRGFKGVYERDQLSDDILNLNERAVLLANAISIDYDYFSRHSRDVGHSGFGTFGGE